MNGFPLPTAESRMRMCDMKKENGNNIIGERIKSLRLQKMMTQKELCGDRITRNMLSAIENGYANPSIDTLMYIAEKLNISAGILISDGESDMSLKKISVIDSIRQAFKRSAYSICIDLCSGIPEDDEINYILSRSYLAIAKEEFDRGDLHKMCSCLDRAVWCEEKTVYSDSYVLSIASRYFKYVNAISKTLLSESVSDKRTWKDDISSLDDEFCRYLLAVDALNGNVDIENLSDFLPDFSKTQYTKHISALELIKKKEFSSALLILKDLVYGQTELGLPIMYNIMKEAELCSKEINNYRDAYDFSNSCISLLDSILKQ